MCDFKQYGAFVICDKDWFMIYLEINQCVLVVMVELKSKLIGCSWLVGFVIPIKPISFLDKFLEGLFYSSVFAKKESNRSIS